MKKTTFVIAALFLACFAAGCASDGYNTQKGAAIGATMGALFGQAIGRDTEATLLGAGIGTVVGSIFGNAVDQDERAVREAAASNKRVVYYDGEGRAVEAIPSKARKRTDCRKVTKRVWENGKMVKETVEEFCEGEKSTGAY